MVKRARNQLGFEIYAADRTQAGIASVHRGFSGLTSGVSRQAGLATQAIGGAVIGNAALTASLAGASMLSFAATSVSAFVEVEKKWAEVTTLMPNLTRQATDEMLREMRTFSRQSGFIISDTLQAAYQAVSGGIAPDETASFLATAGRSARAGVTGITTAVDVLTTVLNAYGLEVEQATFASDALFTAIRLGKTTFEEIAPVLGPVIPLAAAMNTEFQEITAALSALTAQGVPTSIAMTQIRSVLTALSRETPAKTLFENLTGQTYEEYQATGGTLPEALRIIVDEANRLGLSVPEQFGRAEASIAALILTSEEGSDTFDKAMQDVEGATARAAQTMEDTTSTMLEVIRAFWSDVRTDMGAMVVDIGDTGLRVLGAVETHAKRVAQAVLTVQALLNADEETQGAAAAAYAEWVSRGGDPDKYPLIVGPGGQALGETSDVTRAALQEMAESPYAGVRTAAQTVLDEWDRLDASMPPTGDRFGVPSGAGQRAWMDQGLYGPGGFGSPLAGDMNAAYRTARSAYLAARHSRLGTSPQTLNPLMQMRTGYLTGIPEIDMTLTYGTPLDPNFGADAGGGGGGGTLRDIAQSNREILEALRSGQALVVQLDAQVDEGIILRADTVRRSERQIAARLGNVMVERTRSG